MVNSLHPLSMQRSKKSALASSPVLDYLLPELSIWQTDEVRQWQTLENIDAYMLKETRRILKRVRALCSNLALTNATSFNIKLQASGSSNALLITGSLRKRNS
ncbi:MAG: hypothetical protein ACI936_002070 [Paraglaciecola sp.]|jgi:hypothetical protein